MSGFLPSIRAAWSLNAVAGPSRIPPHPLSVFTSRFRRGVHSSAAVKSGHNRWSKIRHKKGAADAQKSQLFSRLTNEIHQALKPPNSDNPSTNSRLATALQKAKDGGVPKAVIENVFARARAVNEGGQNIVYEAVGPSGREALIIETITPNQNRTVQRIKEILHKNGCRIAPVSYLFEKKGVIVISPAERGGGTFEGLFEIAVEHGAEDVDDVSGEEGVEWEISIPPAQLAQLTSVLSSPPHSHAYTVNSSEIAYIPSIPLEVLEPGDEGDGVAEDKAEGIAKVVGLLEEESEVVKVWTNLPF